MGIDEYPYSPLTRSRSFQDAADTRLVKNLAKCRRNDRTSLCPFGKYMDVLSGHAAKGQLTNTDIHRSYIGERLKHSHQFI